MAIPLELSTLLQSASPESRPNPAEMVEILRSAVDELSQALGFKVGSDNWLEDVRPGYIRAWIYSSQPALGPIALTWRGIIVCHLRNDVPGIQIGAVLFMYSHGLQIQTRNGKGFLDLHCVYVKEENRFRWQFDGWHRDEYGEYREFENDRE